MQKGCQPALPGEGAEDTQHMIYFQFNRDKRDGNAGGWDILPGIQESALMNLGLRSSLVRGVEFFFIHVPFIVNRL